MADDVTPWLDEMIAGASHRIDRRVSLTPRRAVLGDARRLRPGWFAIRNRDRRINLEAIERLRLEHALGAGEGFTVMTVVDRPDEVHVQVAEHAPEEGLRLTGQRRPPHLLDQALVDRLKELKAAPGLAAKLSEGALDPIDDRAAAPDALAAAQQRAYRACTTPGAHVVWGPPGTGKTRVLTEAISDLIKAGERVLLISATNIAVDNVLDHLLRSHEPRPGELVRVGQAQLERIATNAAVALPLLIRAQLTELQAELVSVDAKIAEMRATAGNVRLAELVSLLSGFDEAAHAAARRRTDSVDASTAAEIRLADAIRATAAARSSVTEAEHAHAAARAEAAEAAESLECHRKIDEMRAVLRRLHQDVKDIGAELDGYEQAAVEARAERSWSGRRKEKKAVGRIDECRQRLNGAEDLLAWHSTLVLPKIADERRRARFTPDEAHRRTSALSDAERDLRDAEDDLHQAEAAERRARAKKRWAESALVPPSPDDRALIADAEQNGLPALLHERDALQEHARAQVDELATLARQHESILERISDSERKIAPEIVAKASLVATTLARYRTTAAVYQGAYSTVLVDEAGASAFPEIVVAAGRAERTVTLLGDFCQLGPVVQEEHLPKQENLSRWLRDDPFRCLGITKPADALASPAVAVLDRTWRFGAGIATIANGIAYRGSLVPARTPPRAQDDPEVVLVTTDDLGPIGQARAMPGGGRWWPVGALLSNALADHHHALGETVGIVTPYAAQEAATRDLLDDGGLLGRTPAVEVGTAHRFQGREFDVVVLDLVEDGAQPGWIARGRFGSPNRHLHDGARLLNVGLTRAKTRVYVLASWAAIRAAAPGTVLTTIEAAVGQPWFHGLRANRLLGIDPAVERTPTALEHELAEAFGHQVVVERLLDEHTYYPELRQAIENARSSVWLWSPWFAKRLNDVLPSLRAATARGVDVHVFVSEGDDRLIQRFAADLPRLRGAVSSLVHIRSMHEKLLVVDDETVFVGSLNTLSHAKSGGRREVMALHRGRRFAQRVLEHMHARIFAAPPRCPHCSRQADLRRWTPRGADAGWRWSCPNKCVKPWRVVFPSTRRT